MTALPERFDFNFDTDDIDFSQHIQDDNKAPKQDKSNDNSIDNEIEEEIILEKPKKQLKNDDIFKINLNPPIDQPNTVKEDHQKVSFIEENNEENNINDSEDIPLKKTKKRRKRKGELSEKQKAHLEKARIKALEKRREHKRIKDEANKIILEKKRKKKEKLEEAKRIIREKQEEEKRKQQELEFERKYQERKRKELGINKTNTVKNIPQNVQQPKKQIVNRPQQKQEKPKNTNYTSIYDYDIPTNFNHGFYFS